MNEDAVVNLLNSGRSAFQFPSVPKNSQSVATASNSTSNNNDTPLFS